jgi:hypothetical protein
MPGTASVSTTAGLRGLGPRRDFGSAAPSACSRTSLREGSLVPGDPDQPAQKIVDMRHAHDVERFMRRIGVGTLPHEQVPRSTELLGTEVAPRVAEVPEEESE